MEDTRSIHFQCFILRILDGDWVCKQSSRLEFRNIEHSNVLAQIQMCFDFVCKNEHTCKLVKSIRACNSYKSLGCIISFYKNAEKHEPKIYCLLLQYIWLISITTIIILINRNMLQGKAKKKNSFYSLNNTSVSRKGFNSNIVSSKLNTIFS